MRSIVNLHIHTTHSDGGRTVKEVVKEMQKTSVKYFAITDHDCADGNVEAAKLAKKYNLAYFNGVELSTCFSDCEAGLDETWVCHIVGLGFNLEKMQQALVKIKDNKDKTLRELFDLLVADDYDIELENVTVDGKIPERKMISNELINKGYATSANECFERILNTDRYRKYAKSIPSIKEGIEIIHACGGVAIWAHPFGVARGGKKDLSTEQVEKLCSKMIEYRIDGLEAYYHKYSKEQIEFLEKLAERCTMQKSIGTDFHKSPFDEIKHPEYKRLFDLESLVFDVDGVTVDESIINYLNNKI